MTRLESSYQIYSTMVQSVLKLTRTKHVCCEERGTKVVLCPQVRHACNIPVPQTPQAFTLTRISSSRSSGRGTCTIENFSGSEYLHRRAESVRQGQKCVRSHCRETHHLLQGLHGLGKIRHFGCDCQKTCDDSIEGPKLCLVGRRVKW